MNAITDPFLKTAGRILNAGQARSLILTGNIHDLFRLQTGQTDQYVPLVNLLTSLWNVPDRIVIVYELNGPIRFMQKQDREKVRDAWLNWRVGLDSNALAVEIMLASSKAQAELETMSKTFDTNLNAAVGNPTVALELLRQLCLCSRTSLGGKPVMKENLIVIIEAADMVIPQGEISRLSDADRHKVSICQDWFSDPGFMNGDDSVVLLSESRALINRRIASLPQVIEVNVPSPDQEEREEFIAWFEQQIPETSQLRLWSTREQLARFAAGLSIHALMQMLKGACHENRLLTLHDVIDKVQDYIQSQLGEDIVEFKKPAHTLENVIGFTRLKEFLMEELIPRFRSTGPDALPGAAVCGPIGSGKTFIFEAVASELDMVVLVLKNIRSQWFGQTDVIFERLRRVLDALAKVLIFVDEADTQFGGVGLETHSTERRLTGKIQAMMSDPRLRGRVIWLLMTARIHLLSPDIRRPGRVGDLIIPVLDPQNEDRDAFIRWTVESSVAEELSEHQIGKVDRSMAGFSAASFASLRSELKASVSIKGQKLTFDEMMEIIDDHLAPAIGEVRRYQTLQALMNCTRRSLLPEDLSAEKERQKWESEIRELETKGIR